MARMKSALCFVVAFAGLCVSVLNAQTLRIYHIDVEQGASTLIISPGGKTLLIDAGKNGHGPRIKAVMQEAGVNRIDHFVCTHYHEDHFGGIDDLANDPSITIGRAYDRGNKDADGLDDPDKLNEPTFIDYQATVGAGAEELTRGEMITLDPAMTVRCVASGGMVFGEVNPVEGEKENDKSLALYIQFGNFRFFIGGDIEQTTEGKIAALDLVLDVDLYQADHHGSHTSSFPPFLEDLKPTVVIISNGNNKTYKHPRQHTLNNLNGLVPKPKIFQTNKYLQGGLGGNVDNEFIADPETTDTDGTILTTVNGATGQFTVSYGDESHGFAIKTRATATSALVIESLLPDPTDGSDTTNESVTLRNKGAAAVSMVGWMLMDTNNGTWSLTPLGTINSGASKSIRRNGSSMSLNNAGDEIILVGPGNVRMDRFAYSDSDPGVVIHTGH